MIRTKDGAFTARYRRVMRHRGHRKAVVAVAHAMLRAVYHLLAGARRNGIWIPTATIAAMRTESRAGPSSCWNVKATAWYSSRPPERERVT